MNRNPRDIGIQILLVVFFILAVGYLGQVGWGLRPVPTPSPPPAPTVGRTWFEGQRAYKHVLAQMAFGPRVPGTEAAARTRLFIRNELLRVGWLAEQEAFVYEGVRVVNLVARQGQGPVIILGAHYDTRRVAELDPSADKRSQPVPGANDGASGVAVLLELARVLRWDTTRYAVWLYFFDAEDQGRLDGWPWAVGARYAARNLPPDIDVQAVIIVDMVGDADQQLYWEANSTPELRAALWDIAATLGYGAYFIPKEKYRIIDDHVPFLERGIPAVDIIDFDYPYWHTTEDTADKVSPESLERVGRVVQQWVETRR